MKFDGPGLLQDAQPTGGLRPAQRLKLDAASFELPSSLELGLSYDYLMGEQYVVRGVGSFVNNNLAENDWRFGVEVGYTGAGVQLFGRGGYGFSETDKDANGNELNPFGMTLGAGLLYNAPGVNVTVDYAWRDAGEFFSSTNVVSIKLGF
jgi:opacity protein-like surface antigen